MKKIVISILAVVLLAAAAITAASSFGNNLLGAVKIDFRFSAAGNAE